MKAIKESEPKRQTSMAEGISPNMWERKVAVHTASTLRKNTHLSHVIFVKVVVRKATFTCTRILASKSFIFWGTKIQTYIEEQINSTQ